MDSSIDDHDGDGLYEAFVITGLKDGDYVDYSDATVYFVANDLKTDILLNDSAGSYVTSSPDTEDYFLIWNQTFGGPGGTAYVYGCRNGKWYQPKIPDTCDSFWIQNGVYSGIVSDYDYGYHRYISNTYIFDRAKSEFVKIGEELLV